MKNGLAQDVERMNEGNNEYNTTIDEAIADSKCHVAATKEPNPFVQLCHV